MAAGDTRAADPVDIVLHEMESTFCSHHFYKSVVVASNRRKTHPREGACRSINTMNFQYLAMINDYQIVGLTQ